MGQATRLNGNALITKRDLFVSGLERVERAGGSCLRFVPYVIHTIEGRETAVSADNSFVMPIEAIPDAIGKAMMALGRHVLIKPDGSVTVAH